MTIAEMRARLAAQLRGFGIAGTIVFLAITASVTVFTPLAGALVLVWAWLSRTPWRQIGLVRPESWLRGLLIGVALGLAFKFAMKAVVLPLLGAPAVGSALGDLAANPRRALFLIGYMIVGAGFCEELVFRGYLFERLGKLWGDGAGARLMILLATTLFFAGLHYPQGVPGIVNAALGGLLSGTVYLLARKRLFTVIVLHASFDLSALALNYFHLEEALSRSVLG